MKKKTTILGVNFEYDEKNVRIVNPREYESEAAMRIVFEEFKGKTGYKSRRTIKSWIKEWKAHNRLYKWGLFKKNCKDCDLEENEKWYRLLVYQILGN